MEGAHIYDHDRLNWSTTEDAMKGSHVKEVKKMIEEFQRIKVLSLTGSNLSISQGNLLAPRPEVKVVLDELN